MRVVVFVVAVIVVVVVVVAATAAAAVEEVAELQWQQAELEAMANIENWTRVSEATKGGLSGLSFSSMARPRLGL